MFRRRDERFPALMRAVYIIIYIFLPVATVGCLRWIWSEVGSFIADHGNAMRPGLETARSNSLLANIYAIYGCCTASNLVSDHCSRIKQNHSRLRKPSIYFDLFVSSSFIYIEFHL